MATAPLDRGSLGIATSVLFTVASIFSLNRYNYGVGDQVITIPFVKHAIDPGLYPNDLVVAQKPYFYTYLWEVAARVITYLHVDIALLFFVLYAVAMVATFYALYLLALALFSRKDTAVLALYLMLFTRTSLGGINTLDNQFLTRSAVLPFLIFALYYFVRGRFVLSYALLGVGFLLHPLTTIHCAAMIGVASLMHVHRIGSRRLLISIGVFAILASPILIWKALHHPASMSTFSADPRWLALMRLRSSHHVFPFSWDLELFAQTAALLAAFVVSWKYRPEVFQHRAVIGFVVAIIAMWCIGTIFTEWLPLSIVLQIQPFRSTVFLIYFASIYIAHFVVMELRAGPLGGGIGLAVGMVAVALYDAHLWMLAAGALLVTLTLVSLYQRKTNHVISSRHFAVAIAGAGVAISASVYIVRPHISIKNAQSIQWLDVQHWARRSTDRADTFIVPPVNDGFRVESERTIYGDWKDGTQMFFNPEFGYAWFDRMQKLGVSLDRSFEQGFRQVDQTAFVDIARGLRIDNHNVFLVMYRDRSGITLPVAYRNRDFTVYRISD